MPPTVEQDRLRPSKLTFDLESGTSKTRDKAIDTTTKNTSSGLKPTYGADHQAKPEEKKQNSLLGVLPQDMSTIAQNQTDETDLGWGLESQELGKYDFFLLRFIHLTNQSHTVLIR